jgi:DNA end-binding protein Ku
VTLTDRELGMAEQLIQSLAADFQPEKYEDTYREHILELIAQKADGLEVPAPAAAPSAGAVVDLMAALEASLAAAKAGKDGGSAKAGKDGGSAKAGKDGGSEPAAKAG